MTSFVAVPQILRPSPLILSFALALGFTITARAQTTNTPPSVSADAARVVAQGAKAGDIDSFMARVLEHRDEAWKKLHDYVLSEAERFDLTGPGNVRLHGVRREYSWYVRDGYLVRSPVRYDGVAIGDADRRRYEETWLKEERNREARRAKTAAANPSDDTDAGSAQGLVDQRGEPRFISEAFFLKFKFEAGNYYVAGRERIDGRDVVRVEYYPTRLFDPRTAGHDERGRKPRSQKEADFDRRIARDLNKVSVVRLWVDPDAYQVVRYEFENVDFGFLPARWLVRVDSLTASMTMAPAIDGVWLPRDLDVRGDLTLASGTYAFRYGRQLYDYKKAETGARIRSIGDPRR